MRVFLDVAGVGPVRDDTNRCVGGGVDELLRRAIRIDVVRDNGPSEAEFVARSFEELSRYLLALRPDGLPQKAEG